MLIEQLIAVIERFDALARLKEHLGRQEQSAVALRIGFVVFQPCDDLFFGGFGVVGMQKLLDPIQLRRRLNRLCCRLG